MTTVADPTLTGADPIQEPTGNSDPAVKDTLTKAEATALVNKTVQERLARERKTLEAKHAVSLAERDALAVEAYRDEHGLTDEALEKFAELDKTALEVRTVKGKATKAEKALEALQAKYDRAATVLRENLVSKAIIEAASPFANKPSEMPKLLGHRVVVDEESWTVSTKDDEGNPSGESIVDVVKDYLEKNDHHMRPTPGRGGGSFVSPEALPSSASPTDTHAFRTSVLKKGIG